MAVAHYHVVLALYVTFCVCVNTLPIIQDNKQTNGENLRVYIRNKRSEVTTHFCRNNGIYYHHKCRSPEEYRRLKDETRDYEDSSSTDILLFTDTGELVEDTVISMKTSAASKPTTFETTHQEPTMVSFSTVAKEVHTVHQLNTTVLTSTSSARIPDGTDKYPTLKDGTRDNDDFLTTKILFVTDTEQVVADKVTNIKTSAASEPTTFETTHQEPTKLPPSSVTKELHTVRQLNTTELTSTSTARVSDEFLELGMKISTFFWIIFGCCGVFVALCIFFLMYWYYCLRRNKNSTCYSPVNPENNNNDVEAAVPLKVSKLYFL